MKKIIVFLAIVAVASSFAAVDGFPYEPRGKRDPFVPLIGVGRPALTQLDDIISIEDIRLQGIAITARGKKTAIMNGEMVRENDKFGEIEIKKITKRDVKLLISGKEYNVALPEEGGLKSEK